MKYNVRGLREKIESDRDRTAISIETVENEQAQYFGVYEPAGKNGEIWLADFHYLGHAMLFANIVGDYEICSQCGGKIISESYKYCPHCGFKFGELKVIY